MTVRTRRWDTLTPAQRRLAVARVVTGLVSTIAELVLRRRVLRSLDDFERRLSRLERAHSDENRQRRLTQLGL